MTNEMKDAPSIDRIVHDLNNMLGPATLLIDLVLNVELKEEQRMETLRQIQASIVSAKTFLEALESKTSTSG